MVDVVLLHRNALILGDVVMDIHVVFNTCVPNGPAPTASFLPGTLVKTPDGSKKIEDIKAGDEVLSF